MANDSLVTARVIGDVLDPFYNSIDLMVLFNGMPIVSGMELRSPTVSERPRVEIGGDDYRVAYTLVMVDPDAPNPSNPTLREYLHWMVTDIPASTDDTYGREAMCYEAPSPTTGIHRVVLVLFRQLGRETVYAPSSATTSARAPSPAATTSARRHVLQLPAPERLRRPEDHRAVHRRPACCCLMMIMSIDQEESCSTIRTLLYIQTNK